MPPKLTKYLEDNLPDKLYKEFAEEMGQFIREDAREMVLANVANLLQIAYDGGSQELLKSVVEEVSRSTFCDCSEGQCGNEKGKAGYAQAIREMKEKLDNLLR